MAMRVETNPLEAATRMRELYKAKGYSDEWIEKRVRDTTLAAR